MAAVESFKQQTYQHKQLLIINDGAFSVLDSDVPGVTEKRLPPNEDTTLGDLRNLAFDLADGDYLIQWDDDDWHHPERIEQQVNGLKTRGSAVFLKRQIRYSFLTDTAYVYKQGPIHGTILHPRNIRQRYPSLRKSEDTVFMRFFSEQITLDNDPKLYIRFSHGFNTWDEKHIMRRMASKDIHGQRVGFEDSLPETEVYLERILKEHYKWRSDVR